MAELDELLDPIGNPKFLEDAERILRIIPEELKEIIGDIQHLAGAFIRLVKQIKDGEA